MGGPVISIQSSDGSDLVNFVADLSASFDDSHKGVTKYTITDTVTGHSLSIIGGGFTYSGGTLTGGTANAIQINDGGNHYAKIENFNLDAGDVASAFLGGHPTDLFDLFGFTTYEGNQGPDIIEGGDGNEILRGNQGDDTLIGGHGADTLDGGGDNDAASYQNANKGVHANLSDSSNNSHDAQGDSYVSIENLFGSDHNDKLTGTNHNNALSGLDGDDTLRGRNGGDVLYGGDGDDIVIGGQGGDSMYGGSGNDQFNFLESETTASLVGAHSITIGAATITSPSTRLRSGTA